MTYTFLQSDITRPCGQVRQTTVSLVRVTGLTDGGRRPRGLPLVVSTIGADHLT
jgi:hypothetical protein